MVDMADSVDTTHRFQDLSWPHRGHTGANLAPKFKYLTSFLDIENCAKMKSSKNRWTCWTWRTPWTLPIDSWFLRGHGLDTMVFGAKNSNIQILDDVILRHRLHNENERF